MVFLKNTTDKTLFVSEDGTNDHYEMPAGSSICIDLQANAKSGFMCHKKKGMQYYAKGVTKDLPNTGKIILEGPYHE